MINEKDKKITNILQEDARTSNAEVARQLDMAPSAIHERVKKLESKGVIRSYETRVDHKALGLNLVAFVSVKTSDHDLNMVVGEQLAKIPEVQEVHSITGDDCYLIKVITKDPESLGILLRDKIGSIDNVSWTRSSIVLGTLKETTKLPLHLLNGSDDE